MVLLIIGLATLHSQKISEQVGYFITHPELGGDAIIKKSETKIAGSLSVRGAEGVNTENFPVINADPTTSLLAGMTAAKLLGAEYKMEWTTDTINTGIGFKDVVFTLPEVGIDASDFKARHIVTSEFKNAATILTSSRNGVLIMNRELMDKEMDILKEAQVEVLGNAIAKDAVVMVVADSSKFTSLTKKDIQELYTRRFDSADQNLRKLGVIVNGFGTPLYDNFISLVMDGQSLDIYSHFSAYPNEYDTYRKFSKVVNPIFFSSEYFNRMMVNPEVYPNKVMSINGTKADMSTLRDGSYPFINSIWLYVRKDAESPAMQVYEFLCSEEGRNLIMEAGFTPQESASLPEISTMNPLVINNGVLIMDPDLIMEVSVYDISGHRKTKVAKESRLDLRTLGSGIYIIRTTNADGTQDTFKFMR